MPRPNTQVVTLKVKSKRLPKGLADWLRNTFNRWLGLEAFNAVYSRLPPCEATELSQAFLDHLAIKVEIGGVPLTYAPARGPLIFVANHPHGLVDGLALDALLTPKRPDAALMAVYVLGEIPEFRERIILVDPERKRSRRRHNLRGWREAYKLLTDSRALAVFPSGAVSRFSWRELAVRDPEWSVHIATLARRTGAAVVPIFIHGRNSRVFQIIGMVSPKLQNLLIFGELPRMRGRTVRITSGEVIPAGVLAGLPSDEATIAFLRHEVEKLKHQ